VLLIVAAELLYYAAHNIDAPFNLITPGAVVAVVLWLLASLGFSFYVSNFSNYNATYGSVGGVIVALTYFFISAAVLLLGAELNAQVYRIRQGRPVPADQAKATQDRPKAGREQMLVTPSESSRA